MSTTTCTIADLTARTGVTTTTGHDLGFGIPVLTGAQRQGDVLLVPAPDSDPATTPVPATGTPVVRGENGGNTHTVFADGPDVTCDVYDPNPTNLRVAILTVPAGSTAYLAHPEHAFNGIGPGTYEVRRQRELADQLRIVAD